MLERAQKSSTFLVVPDVPMLGGRFSEQASCIEAGAPMVARNGSPTRPGLEVPWPLGKSSRVHKTTMTFICYQSHYQNHRSAEQSIALVSMARNHTEHPRCQGSSELAPNYIKN